jgi:hypothetical protein
LNQKYTKDIQQGINWYNQQGEKLGDKFYGEVRNALEQLKISPFFQVRYDNVSCLPLKKFPYMVHFTIHEADKLVIIRAIFNTARDPKLWQGRSYPYVFRFC